jgi:hypothetical protein
MTPSFDSSGLSALPWPDALKTGADGLAFVQHLCEAQLTAALAVAGFAVDTRHADRVVTVYGEHVQLLFGVAGSRVRLGVSPHSAWAGDSYIDVSDFASPALYADAVAKLAVQTVFRAAAGDATDDDSME